MNHPYIWNLALQEDYLEVMNFLNEINIQFPEAISFAPGRPDASFFDVQKHLGYIEKYIAQSANIHQAWQDLGQYNKTKGIINPLIAQLLWNDEKITVSPEHILLTDGAQEAMVIVIDSFFQQSNEVLLVSDLSYIGFVGYAKIKGIEIQTFRRDNEGIDLDDLEKTIQTLISIGKKPKILYEIPDFHNPTGNYLPLTQRRALLDLAERYDFWIVEDNPYGYFLYEGTKIPTLKALDSTKRVIYIGSFSKVLFPSLRMGFLVADQTIQYQEKTIDLIEEMKKTKSLTTINSSTILQAIVGGVLLEEKNSLQNLMLSKIEAYLQKRDTLCKSLTQYFSRSAHPTLQEINWNIPQGGFFLQMNLPFSIKNDDLYACVKEFGVIFCPMYFFALNPEKHHQSIRLSFSSLSEEKISKGIERLASFFAQKLESKSKIDC